MSAVAAATAASLIVDGLRAASAILEFIETVSDNDDALDEIVEKARAEGATIGKEEIRTAIADMKAARTSLESKIGAAPVAPTAGV